LHRICELQILKPHTTAEFNLQYCQKSSIFFLICSTVRKAVFAVEYRSNILTTVWGLLMLARKSMENCFFFFLPTKSMFGSVVAGAFQIAFRAEMHVNDVFLFFKNYF
jgi:hypothetical protein